MRDRIALALKEAIKGHDKRRISTLRLVNAAIQDRDIALRGKGKDRADDEEVMDILLKMVKQREESSRLYRQGGRPELEAQEMEEIAIIRGFLPRQMTDEETASAVGDAVEATQAQSLRYMGKVMAWLKERFPGQMDMGRAGSIVKAALSGK